LLQSLLPGRPVRKFRPATAHPLRSRSRAVPLASRIRTAARQRAPGSRRADELPDAVSCPSARAGERIHRALGALDEDRHVGAPRCATAVLASAKPVRDQNQPSFTGAGPGWLRTVLIDPHPGRRITQTQVILMASPSRAHTGLRLRQGGEDEPAPFMDWKPRRISPIISPRARLHRISMKPGRTDSNYSQS